MNQEIGRMVEDMEGLKTYLSGALAWLLCMLPATVNEWTSIFNCIAAFFALILVIWRMQHDMFRKARRTDDKDRLDGNTEV